MSSIVDILESVAKYGGTVHLTKFLKSCDDCRAFYSNNAETHSAIAVANRLLNETSSRRDGLVVLKCLLGQLPRELLQANILSWIQPTLKGLCQKESYSTVVIAADVTCILLSLSSKFADCRKEVSLAITSKIFEVLYDLKNSHEFLKLVLSTLSTLLQYYSKSAASWKEKFEKFLFTLIEHDEETVFLASRCYLRLAASGPPGTDFKHYKEAWSDQFTSLTLALHFILDKLFDDVNEIEQISRGRIQRKPDFQVPPVQEKMPYLKISRLTQQFASLCQFLKVMLLGQFPVSKRVAPDLLLSIACRGLAVTAQTLQAHETADTPSLSAVLPQLHSSCLSIITALIKRSVRIMAYDCLTVWLTTANCSSGVEKHAEIIDHLISDFRFKKPAVTLNFSSKMLKGKLGKKQRQALVNQTVNNKEEYSTDKESNKDVCCAALKVVPVLLESASSLLPPEAHKDLQSAISTELIMTQLNLAEHVPLPYSDRSCRLGLYKSFMATCLNYHPSFPPPLSSASQLISCGLQDPCHEIMQFCFLASSALDKMLRPIGPTLSFPIELPEMFSAPIVSNLVAEENVSAECDTIPNESASTESNSIHRTEEPRNTNLDEAGANGRVYSNSENDLLPPLNVSGTPKQYESPSNLSPKVPEINPLLVDPEMSEFDFLNCGEESISSQEPEGSHPVEETVDSTVGMCSAQPAVISQQNGRARSPDVDDVVPKRKPFPDRPSESPVPKKSKSSFTEVSAVDDQLDREEMAVDPVSDISSDRSGSKTNERRTGELCDPENDLEEEMLSSFVDAVN